MVETTVVETTDTHNDDTVRNYEPSLEDIFIVIPSGDYQRLIFSGGQPLREREETHMNDFRQFLEAKSLSLPAGYDDESRNVLRFLQALKWDYQKTYDAILEHAKWRATVNVTDVNPVLKFLETGMIYAYKRDKNLRPVIVVNVVRVMASGIEIEPLMETVDYFTNYTIENCMEPGHVESWTCIFDMKDVSLTKMPKKHLQAIVKCMANNYRGRLFRFYATDVTWLFRGMWKMAHRMVDEFTKSKLLIYGDEYPKDLHELVDPANLEEKYGGSLPNKTENFWPPQMN